MFLKFPKSECPVEMDTSSTTQVAQITVKHRRPPWFLSNEIHTDNRLLASSGKDFFEEVLFGTSVGKSTEWECVLVHRKQGLFSSVWMI